MGSCELEAGSLLASLPGGNPDEGTAVPVYSPISPSPENRWRLSPHAQEPGYESWPGLDELFPVHFQGVNHNRGLEGSVIDTEKEVLRERMTRYFGAGSFGAAAEASPDIATPRARYDPEKAWSKLKGAGAFAEKKLKPFLAFPLDERWIYYETEYKWLNEARPEFGAISPAMSSLSLFPSRERSRKRGRCPPREEGE